MIKDEWGGSDWLLVVVGNIDSGCERKQGRRIQVGLCNVISFLFFSFYYLAENGI